MPNHTKHGFWDMYSANQRLNIYLHFFLLIFFIIYYYILYRKTSVEGKMFVALFLGKSFSWVNVNNVIEGTNDSIF